MPPKNLNLYVQLPKWLYPRWWEVAYLIVGPDGWLKDELAKLIQIAPDERFNEVVSQHVSAYVHDGTMPPAEIAPAILNLADDVMAGRKMTIRAGDYISLQQFARQARPK
jgi:hypothetical protein